jgi:hypothetical protein
MAGEWNMAFWQSCCGKAMRYGNVADWSKPVLQAVLTHFIY